MVSLDTGGRRWIPCRTRFARRGMRYSGGWRPELPAVFDSKRWAGMLMNLAMTDPGAEGAVVPLRGCPPHPRYPGADRGASREYFLDHESRFPPLLKRLLAGVESGADRRDRRRPGAAQHRVVFAHFHRRGDTGGSAPGPGKALAGGKRRDGRHPRRGGALGAGGRRYLDLYLELIATPRPRDGGVAHP